jgi:hypothetical protein
MEEKWIEAACRRYYNSLLRVTLQYRIPDETRKWFIKNGECDGRNKEISFKLEAMWKWDTR